MINYQESAVTGTKWLRCNVVHVDNPYQGQPVVTFSQEEMVEVGTDVFSKPLGQIVFDFDPAEVIPLVNPENGELTGKTISGAEVYAALYSYYIAKANS